MRQNKLSLYTKRKEKDEEEKEEREREEEEERERERRRNKQRVAYRLFESEGLTFEHCCHS